MRKLPVLAVVLILLLAAGGATWRFVLRGDAPASEPGGGGAAIRVEPPEPQDPALVGRAAGGSAQEEPAPGAAAER